MVVLVVQVMNWCYPVAAVLEEEAIDDVMVWCRSYYYQYLPLQTTSAGRLGEYVCCVVVPSRLYVVVEVKMIWT